MSLAPDWLPGQLRALEAGAAPPARYLVGLSGGLDSTVLLYLLARSGPGAVPIEAVHVDHGLHGNASTWAVAARSFAERLGIPCRVVRVDVGYDGGPEAAARAARYAAFRDSMRPGDWLLLAHHRDDQAETLLLNLMRASGPAGLAAMPGVRPFGAGYLARPLLGTARDELLACARQAGLTWIDDPSNEDESLDRNFLRHRVLPLLESRWPGAAARLATSAAHAAHAAALLAAASDDTLLRMGAVPGRLPVAALRQLTESAAANVLRRAVDIAGLPKIPLRATTQILATLLHAREDAAPEVRWAGAVCRRYREQLYLLPAEAQADFEGRKLLPGRPVSLGQGYGRLELEKTHGTGIAPHLAEAGLELRSRAGGERIRPTGDAHTRQLKKLLQDAAIYPWRRSRLPLLFAGERLVAVANLWLDRDAVATPGYEVRWVDAPALADEMPGAAQLSAACRSDNV